MRLHDFITAVRPRDFGLVGEPGQAIKPQRIGKRMFRDTHLFGIPVRAATPATANDFGCESIYAEVRDKHRTHFLLTVHVFCLFGIFCTLFCFNEPKFEKMY